MTLKNVINQEEVEQLKEEGNIEFIRYAGDRECFAIVGRNLYIGYGRKYVLLKENFRDNNSTQSSQ